MYVYAIPSRIWLIFSREPSVHYNVSIEIFHWPNLATVIHPYLMRKGAFPIHVHFLSPLKKTRAFRFRTVLQKWEADTLTF